MSRVDEAIRRAAARAAASDVDVTPAPVEQASDASAADLADAFPAETPEPLIARAAGARTADPGPPLVVESPSAPVGQRGASVTKDAKASEVAQDAADAAAGHSARPRENAGSVFDRIDSRLSEKVVIDQQMSPGSREQYRRLAAVLHDAQGNKGLQVIMVVSATAGEGKTLTAANLALTFSESYQRRVLLIDADLRRPALHSVFRIDTASGLGDGLSDPTAKLVLRQISPRLAVLPAGRPSQDPMAGLTSERMRQLIAEAREAFDWVIIDTPPLGILPDAHLLASMVEGAVMVIRAGSTPLELVKRSVESVGRSLILGVVLNGATPQAGKGEYGYEYYGYGAKETLPVRS